MVRCLRVLDSAGDGMTSGGYVLHDASGRRIIDNRDDGVFGSESSIAANGSFYVPMGAGKPIFTACDKPRLGQLGNTWWPVRCQK